MPSTATDRLNGLSTSVAVKAPCRTVATANITLSGLQTINGVTVLEGDRVLVKGQTTVSQNGIYLASTGSWERAADFDGNRDVVRGTIVPIAGTGDSVDLYEVVTNNPITIGTTSLSFASRIGSNIRWDRTDAEIAASVTPSNYNYQPGDVRRYGAVGDDITNCSAAFQAAQDQAVHGGVIVFIPAGTWRIQSAVTLSRGVIIQGCSRLRTLIHVVGAITGFICTEEPSESNRGSSLFSDFYIYGSSTAGALFALTTFGLSTFERIKFGLTGALGLVTLTDECHSTRFRDCYFHAWKDHAVYCDGLNSVLVFDSCRFNIVTSLDGSTVTASTSSCIRIEDTADLCISSCEANGDEELGNFLRITGSSGRVKVFSTYVEGITGPSILTESTGLLNGFSVEDCDLNTTDSSSIDLSAGAQQHEGVSVRRVRRGQAGGAFVILNPGSTIDYIYDGLGLDCSHVTSFLNNQRVERYGDRYLVDQRTRSTVGPFTMDNVAASQTNAPLSGTRWIAPRDGSLTGVVVKSTESRTAGTLTIEVRKNTGLSGASGTQLTPTAVLDGTNTNRKATIQAPGTDTFDAGDELYCTITTDGSWLPTTADVRVYLEIES